MTARWLGPKRVYVHIYNRSPLHNSHFQGDHYSQVPLYYICIHKHILNKNLKKPKGSCLCREDEAVHDGGKLPWSGIHHSCLQHINRLSCSGCYDALRTLCIWNHSLPYTHALLGTSAYIYWWWVNSSPGQHRLDSHPIPLSFQEIMGTHLHQYQFKKLVLLLRVYGALISFIKSKITKKNLIVCVTG